MAPFQDVIADMGQVMERINAHFGTDFDPFNHTEAAVASVHAERGGHAGPSDRRDRLKAEMRAAFEETLRMDSSLQEKMTAAEQRVKTYVSEAESVARR